MGPLSLAIVGADHPNKRGPARRFELAICVPGEPLELRPEPKNPADENAIAVYSCRGIQIGYVTSVRASWFIRMLADGREIVAIYQGPAAFGGWARVAFDGEQPVLPTPVAAAAHAGDNTSGDDDGFWPDPIYDD